ncbi:MAG: hypothetical protein QM535_09500 [Limnohabitans sp.]|nr:hypothetical protein [Limnohabitans sp.]
MKLRFLMIVFGLLTLSVQAQIKSNKMIASNCSLRGCTGSEYCTACKNCSGCAHCNSGGTCGVCNPSEIKVSKPKKKKRSK